MFGLLTVSPRYCPICGKKIEMGKSSRDDFYHCAAFTCDCGFHYQHVPERIILKAADEAGGDMRYRAEGG